MATQSVRKLTGQTKLSCRFSYVFGTFNIRLEGKLYQTVSGFNIFGYPYISLRNFLTSF